MLWTRAQLCLDGAGVTPQTAAARPPVPPATRTPHGVSRPPRGGVSWNAAVRLSPSFPLQHHLPLTRRSLRPHLLLSRTTMAPPGFSPATLHRLHPHATSSPAAFRIPSSSSLSSPASESARCSSGSGSRSREGLGFGLRNARGAIRACLGQMDSSLAATEWEQDAQDSVRLGVVVPAREEIFSDAVRALRNGHVLAVPTDTLYGLACDASSAEAVRRVYEIKERKLSSPLAMCVADVGVVGVYGETSHLPTGLLPSLLPGAVTLLLPRRESGHLSPSLNPGVASIGIRVPESDFIRGLSRSFGGALALTSANTSSHASTVRVEEFEHLWPHCAFVFDAGTLPGDRAGSTIIDLTQQGVFKVVRPGSVLQKTRETLAEFGLRDSSS